MRDDHRESRFSKFSTPILVLAPDGTVLYRNKALTGILCRLPAGGSFLGYLPEGRRALDDCLATGRPAVTTVRDGALTLPLLLIPDREKEERTVIAVFADFLSGKLDFSPSGHAPRAEDPDVSALPREHLPEVAHLLVAPLAAAIRAGDERQEEPTPVCDVVRVLDRCAKKILEPRGLICRARCTDDCAQAPVARGAEFSAALVCLATLFSANARDAAVDLTFFIEQKILRVLISFLPRERIRRARLSDAAPDRAPELELLRALLDKLGFDLVISDHSDRILVEIAGTRKLPAHFFRGKSVLPPRDDRAVERFVEEITAPVIYFPTEEHP